jgi:hypothetical protein
MSRCLTLRACLFVAALATGFIAFLLIGLFAPASAPVSASALPKSTPAALADRPSGIADCGPAWQVITSPNVSPYDELHSVAAQSDADVWAVGHSSNGRTLTEHWDGIAWSVVPSPNRGSGDSELLSVSAISAADVWAVGDSVSDSVHVALTEHWDGRAWTVVPSPNIGTDPNYLNAVAAVSSSDVWAVGYYFNGTTRRTLTEHWNGSAWNIVQSGNVGTGNNVLSGVSAASGNDVWAVGDTPDHELIEHWNGTEWSVVPGPQARGLYAVAALSSTDVWAVGSADPVSFGTSTLTEHWDGTAWSVVPSSDVDQFNTLYSISAVSSNDIWAVGVHYSLSQGATSGGETHALLEHWDGMAWSAMPGADLPSSEYIYAVATWGGNAWAVGNTEHVTLSALIEHYTAGPCPPTFTPVPPRCPSERFTDVCPGDYFYQYILDLSDLGIIAGYNTVPPCAGPAHIPCFRPDLWSTRGQIAKIISLAAGFNEDVTGQTFEDVPPNRAFYLYIERMVRRGIITGYPCGGLGEPCNANNDPYFRPGNTVSRGQVCKMVCIAFGFTEPVGMQDFEDVPPGHTYYDYIQRLAGRNIINGYPCGGPGEPCGPSVLPFFRPAGSVSRGQITKIVDLARTQPTPTPIATTTGSPAPTDTPTPLATGTVVDTATLTPTTAPTYTATGIPTSTP